MQTATASDDVSKVTDQLQRTKVDNSATDKEEAEPPSTAGAEQETPEDSAEHADSPDPVPAPAETDYPLTHCLFCNVESESLPSNADHMYKQHGMFVPERSYLVNPTGLVKYLYAKITENFECLYCHKLKSSAEAIQTHMRDKSHCMIAYSSEEEMVEIGQFYDFRSTYSDDEDDDDEATEVVEGGDGDDEGWETDASSDEDESAGNVYANEGDLHLPSGRVAGHRSLAKYFRQNLRHYAVTPEERVSRQKLLKDSAAEKEEKKSGALVSRANGGLGLVNASDFQKKEARKTERRDQKRAQRMQNQYQWHVNKMANNQKHYRVWFLSLCCCGVYESSRPYADFLNYRNNFSSDLLAFFPFHLVFQLDERSILNAFCLHPTSYMRCENIADCGP